MIGADPWGGQYQTKERLMEKRCTKCRKVKVLSDFHADRGEKDGRRAACKVCVCAAWRKRYADNEEVMREYERRKRRTRNPEIHKKANAKLRGTPKGKLNNCMSRSIWHSLKNGSKGGRHWENLVGFTVDQLKKHLEKKFGPGMTWENYGTYWHIDHETPIAVFNFENPENIDFKRCWALKNLRPLEAKENMAKNARIDKPFQPSLNIST